MLVDTSRMTSPPRSMAILRLSALGDVCLTIPLVRLLQQQLPSTQMHWIINRRCYPLVEDLPNIHFIVIDKPSSFKTYWTCYQILRHFSFDVLLMPQATMRTNILSLFIKAHKKYGYDSLHSRNYQKYFITHSIASEPEHLLDSFLRFAEPWRTQSAHLDWPLPIRTQDRQWIQSLCAPHSGHWLAICLHSSKKERDWPVDRYLTLLQKLAKQWSFNLFLIGDDGHKNLTMVTRIIHELSLPCINLIGKTSLKQLTAVLAHADVLVSPDSGPVHIATALHTPVVGLYAVASPEKTGPYRQSRWIINKFPTAAHQLLKKQPTDMHWHARIHDQTAMAMISIDDVHKKLNDAFTYLRFKPASFSTQHTK